MLTFHGHFHELTQTRHFLKMYKHQIVFHTHNLPSALYEKKIDVNPGNIQDPHLVLINPPNPS